MGGCECVEGVYREVSDSQLHSYNKITCNRPNDHYACSVLKHEEEAWIIGGALREGLMAPPGRVLPLWR
jgi:hypothetical protein